MLSSIGISETMSLRRMFCSQKALTWMLTFNLIALGVIVLVGLDTGMFSSKAKLDQNAYDRWLKIRRDFGSYHKERSNEAERKRIKSLQLDKVVGFDFMKSAQEKRDHKKLVGGIDSGQGEEQFSLTPLQFIPPVPKYSESDVVAVLAANITQHYLSLPAVAHTQKIVILTPVCDVASILPRYAKQLKKLTYPHDLMSVYFGEDSSSDRTLDMATLIAQELTNKYGFKDGAAYHFNITGGVHGDWADVHHRTSQHERRSHLAKARNMLLEVALELGKFDYVLWIDSDITQLPVDLVEQLLYAKSDVVAASCLFYRGSYKRVFDKNSWRETPTSIQDQADLPKDILLVEGYSFTYRIYLPHLRAEGRVVPLDGVGGCALLVRAACHENGLIFPEDVYSHHIETEGLAKMAINMGYKVRGAPFVEVFH